jgi:pimeloyl-ACP methyl ester carboxylesterase
VIQFTAECGAGGSYRSVQRTEEDARQFAEAIPRGRWIAIPGAGHSVQGDQPKALVEALRAFLEEID